VEIQINNKPHTIPVEWQEASLLDVLRELFGYTGSKFGCGQGLCGACTVHVDGEAARACVLPVTAIGGKAITTIDGLAEDNQLHPVQQAWIDESVPQCGYCQAGQIMTAAALLAKSPDPTAQEITLAMDANICRCGTYSRIRRGVARAAELAKNSDAADSAATDSDATGSEATDSVATDSGVAAEGEMR